MRATTFAATDGDGGNAHADGDVGIGAGDVVTRRQPERPHHRGDGFDDRAVPRSFAGGTIADELSFHFDLALRNPGFCKRMTRRLPSDEWLFPNINTGGVVKFDEQGKIIETLGDMTGASHPMVTSMREHKGYLYVGGILNNRIGRYKIPGAEIGRAHV